MNHREGNRRAGPTAVPQSEKAPWLSHNQGGTPMRLRKTLSLASTVCLIALGYAVTPNGQQNAPPAVYNPFPPGILSPDLDSEIARVLGEIDLIEGRSIERCPS